MHAAEFVESYFDAWNHHDAGLVASHLTADGTYCDIPDQQQHSRDELLATLTSFFALNTQRYELIGEILAGRDSIAFQYRVSSPDTLENTFFGAEFVTFDGRGAIRILDYYNVPGLASAADTTRLVLSSALPRKYAKSGLSDAQMENYERQLSDLMHIERVFLEPDLTLPGLAVRVGCSVNHLSQVINSGFGAGFFDYLNQQRVEYAKQLLRRQDGRQRSILSIALAAGFNSHSSFYSAFKKASGQTPAQFRRSQVVKPL